MRKQHGPEDITGRKYLIAELTILALRAFYSYFIWVGIEWLLDDLEHVRSGLHWSSAIPFGIVILMLVSIIALSFIRNRTAFILLCSLSIVVPVVFWCLVDMQLKGSLIEFVLTLTIQNLIPIVFVTMLILNRAVKCYYLDASFMWRSGRKTRKSLLSLVHFVVFVIIFCMLATTLESAFPTRSLTLTTSASTEHIWIGALVAIALWLLSAYFFNAASTQRHVR